MGPIAVLNELEDRNIPWSCWKSKDDSSVDQPVDSYWAVAARVLAVNFSSTCGSAVQMASVSNFCRTLLHYRAVYPLPLAR
jgi:hypothetical protein